MRWVDCCTTLSGRTKPRFCFSESSSTFNRPICSSRAACTASWSASAVTAPCRKRLGQRRQRRLLPLRDLDRMHAEPDASSPNVRSPRTAATGTFALTAALCCRRVAIVGPPRRWAHDLNLAGCPDSGVQHTPQYPIISLMAPDLPEGEPFPTITKAEVTAT